MCRWATYLLMFLYFWPKKSIFWPKSTIWYLGDILPRRSKSTPTGTRAAWKATFVWLSWSHLLHSTQQLDRPGAKVIVKVSFLIVCNLNGPAFPFWLFWFGYCRLPLSGQTFKGDATVAGWGATLEGGQINGTLLSAQVGLMWIISFCLFLSLWNYINIWKVPLVDQAGCKTIYGEALHQVNGKVVVPTSTDF